MSVNSTIIEVYNVVKNTSKLPSNCLGSPDATYNNTYVKTGYSFEAVVAISVFVGIFCLYVLLGNIAVILIIFRDKVVASQAQNQYLVSLAVADALLAVFIIPFSLVNEVTGTWPFGRTYCNIYLAADVLLCTASIWSICAIGLDRYWSVKRPIENRRKRTKKVIRLIILMVWALSFIISVPPFIFGFKLIPTTTERSCFINDARCFSMPKRWLTVWIAEMLASVISSRQMSLLMYLMLMYILFSSTLSFFLPATIITPVYTKIYIIGRRHSRPHNFRRKSKGEKEEKLDQSKLIDLTLLEKNGNMETKEKTEDQPNIIMPFSSSCNSLQSPTTENQLHGKSVSLEYADYKCIYTTKNGKLSLPTKQGKQRGNNSVDARTDRQINKIDGLENPTDVGSSTIPERPFNSCNIGQRHRMCSAASTHSVFSMTSLIVFFKRRNRNEPTTSCLNKRMLYYHKRERRFTLIICLVTGGFLCCWYPFFQTYVAYALCGKTCCIDKIVFKAVFWLGYLNSGLNPAIYTIFNKEFRRAFRKLFFCSSDSNQQNWRNVRLQTR